MNIIRRIRRFAVVLAGLAAALVAFATPAFAVNYPLPANGGQGTSTYTPPPPTITVWTTGGGGVYVLVPWPPLAGSG